MEAGVVAVLAGSAGLVIGLLLSVSRSRRLRQDHDRLSHALGQSSRRNERLMRQNGTLMLLLDQAAQGEAIDVIRGAGGEVQSYASGTHAVAVEVDSHRKPAGRGSRHGIDERRHGSN